MKLKRGQPEDRDPAAIQISLHVDAVARPAQTAARACREVIDLYFDALSKADLSQPPPPADGAFFRFSIAGSDISADQRRSMHEHWVLAKAFQDLMRGVRGSLEQAYFFTELLSVGSFKAEMDTTLNELLAPFRAKAQRAHFPELMGAVNKHFDTPIAFAEAYGSLQSARNCLEHRNGIVSRKDANADGVLKMSVPRMKAFIEQDGKEVEIYRNFYVQAETEIKLRIETRDLVFRIGDEIKINVADFNDIAFACSNFGTMLAQQLSKVGAEASHAA